MVLIGHAGLAADRLHGTPDRRHLETAAHLDPERLELDVCVTADSVLVARHDQRVEPANVSRCEQLLRRAVRPMRRERLAPPAGTILSGTPVAELPLQALRRLDPGVLTLDEAAAILGRRIPLLLDLKVPSAAPLLAHWLRHVPEPGRIAVCTPSLPALRRLRELAPRTERWPTIPGFGRRRRDHLAHTLSSLRASHPDLDRCRDSLSELGRAAAELPRRPHDVLAAVAALPWRWHLPELATAWSREVCAAGLCVPHWLVTPELFETAARLRLPLTAFTVNQAWALRRVLDCGAEMVTTDRLSQLRRLLGQSRTPAGAPQITRASAA